MDDKLKAARQPALRRVREHRARSARHLDRTSASRRYRTPARPFAEGMTIRARSCSGVHESPQSKGRSTFLRRARGDKLPDVPVGTPRRDRRRGQSRAGHHGGRSRELRNAGNGHRGGARRRPRRGWPRRKNYAATVEKGVHPRPTDKRMGMITGSRDRGWCARPTSSSSGLEEMAGKKFRSPRQDRQARAVWRRILPIDTTNRIGDLAPRVLMHEILQQVDKGCALELCAGPTSKETIATGRDGARSARSGCSRQLRRFIGNRSCTVTPEGVPPRGGASPHSGKVIYDFGFAWGPSMRTWRGSSGGSSARASRHAAKDRRYSHVGRQALRAGASARNGAGWYRYEPARPRRSGPEVEGRCRMSQRRRPRAEHVGRRGILARCLWALVNREAYPREGCPPRGARRDLLYG